MSLLLVLLALCIGGLPLLAQARDTRPPIITITQPTTATTYSTTATQLTLRGTAKDQGKGIARVTWATDRGNSGTAQGTTNWSFVLLVPSGTTQVMVTAVDHAGNLGTDTFTVVQASPPPPGPITLDWTTTETGDAFQIERCVQGTSDCPGIAMQAIAAVSISTREWIDTTVTPDHQYCYRLATIQGATLGPYSNTACD